MKLSQKQRRFRIVAILPFGKIAPYESASRLSHIYNSAFAFLSLSGFPRTYADLARLHGYVTYTKRTHLTCSQAGIQ